MISKRGMDFERGFGKRGQEGLTLTTLLLIILGVVAVVVVILFFTGFFGKLSNASNNLPSDLQTAVSACEIAGSSGLTADYCLSYRKVTIDGEEQYATCDYSRIRELTANEKEIAKCDPSINAAKAQEYCNNQKLKVGTLVQDTISTTLACKAPSVA